MCIGLLIVSYFVLPNSRNERVTRLPVAIANEDQVEDILRLMTLEDKVGQMIVFGFASNNLDQHSFDMIEKFRIGGVVLFDRNMQNPRQVTNLINELQSVAHKSGHYLPLFICIDQEGGIVTRMDNYLTKMPSQQQVASYGGRKEVAKFADMTGKELGSMGFNVNFAPVLDLASRSGDSVQSSRSFGDDPKRVAELGKVALENYNDNKIISTLKHFPGIGKANRDLHEDQAVIGMDKKALIEADVEPFLSIIKTTNPSEFMVMISHSNYPAVDSQPASISPTIIQDLLRSQLNFQGVIISDDMEMRAMAKYYSFEKIGVLAVRAGIDIVLVCHTFEAQRKVYQGILDAVRKGEINEELINNSARRIIGLKLKATQKPFRDPSEAIKMVGNAYHQKSVSDFLDNIPNK